MSPVKHVSKDLPATAVGSTPGMLSDRSSSSPKSPKFNELRARHEILQNPENDLKPPKPKMGKS